MTGKGAEGFVTAWARLAWDFASCEIELDESASMLVSSGLVLGVLELRIPYRLRKPNTSSSFLHMSTCLHTPHDFSARLLPQNHTLAVTRFI